MASNPACKHVGILGGVGSPGRASTFEVFIEYSNYTIPISKPWSQEIRLLVISHEAGIIVRPVNRREKAPSSTLTKGLISVVN
jgi:hypothetical protein